MKIDSLKVKDFEVTAQLNRTGAAMACASGCCKPEDRGKACCIFTLVLMPDG